MVRVENQGSHKCILLLNIALSKNPNFALDKENSRYAKIYKYKYFGKNLFVGLKNYTERKTAVTLPKIWA